MSFSSDVKEELSRLIPKPVHCKSAELAAAMMFAGEIGIGTEEKKIIIRTEQVILAKKYFTLIKKIFGFNAVLIYGRRQEDRSPISTASFSKRMRRCARCWKECLCSAKIC